MDTNGSEKSNPDSLKQAKEAVTETVKSATAPIRHTIGKHLLLKMLVLAVIALIALHFLSVITIPFSPFTTKGKIYVDSPEVYTRERLVNDRYDQDYWLRKQLKRLDELELWLVQEKRAASVVVVAGKSSAAVNSTGSAAPSGEGRLTFDQEFRIVSGIRDMIRQQILENMLDDRHDLTGNSVYGLKFDTTVIPGSNTRGRAFVHVKLKINNLFNREASSGLGDHIMGYIASRATVADQNEDESQEEKNLVRAYTKQHDYYLNWLNDIAKRLNRMEDSVYEDMQDKCPENGQNFYDELTRRTLEIVLGIPHERFSELNQDKTSKDRMSNWVALPPPWANFFKIIRKKGSLGSAGEGECSSSRVWFEVHALEETLFPFHKSALRPFLCGGKESEKECAKDEKRVSQIVPIGEVGDGEWILYIDRYTDALRSETLGESNTGPQYEFSIQSIEELLKTRKDCNYSDGYRKMSKMLNHCGILTPSGFFNFAEHLSSLDAYSYAIFPKNDMVGVLSETSATLAGTAPGSGFLGIRTGLSESRTASVMVGYGDGKGSDPGNGSGRAGGDGSIAFGWVISTRGDMEPTLKNQLALVSVPAWTDKLQLTIHVGWLNRESNPLSGGRDEFDVSISVPPDYEAFDSIFRNDAWVTHGPRIQDDAMDKDIYVRSGREVKILIPGSRLWRSASVTLGAQLARRIRVLPNMEGIIAEFDEIDLPHAAYNEEADVNDDMQGTAKHDKCGKIGKLDSRPVRLRVWTSEGVAKASRPVCVFYDMAEVESGGETNREEDAALEVPDE